jgi:hypothetical protein
MSDLRLACQSLDHQLSRRFIDLDPGGYWIIAVDRSQDCLQVEHYSNDINEQGLAVDPETQEVIACKNAGPRQPSLRLQGLTAKALCVQIFEELTNCPVTRLDHAAYLGRELVRAEQALLAGEEYIQD